MGAFFAAVQTGDVKQVESFLAQDARAVMDGGGQKTARNVVRGAGPVARLYAGLSQKRDPGLRYEIREVNGWPALVILRAEVLVHRDRDTVNHRKRWLPASQGRCTSVLSRWGQPQTPASASRPR